MITLNSLRLWWDKKPLFAYFSLFISLFTIFSLVYLPTDGISTADDHFFHYRLAKMIREQGWEPVNNFHWVYFSNQSEDNERYGVSFFQLSIIPFTFIADEIVGLKLMDIFQLCAALTLFYYVLRKLKIPYALFYILFFLSSYYFLARFLAGRAFPLIASLLFFEFYLVSHKKYKQFFFTAIFHILWHQSTFFFPLIIALIVEVARYILEERAEKRTIYAGLVAPIIGLAFYPGYPGNLWQWMAGILRIHSNVFDTEGIRLIEGKELKQIDPSWLFKNSDIFFLLAIIGVSLAFFYYIRSKRSEDIPKPEQSKLLLLLYATTIFLLACILGMIGFSGRFYDFYFHSTIFLFAIGATMLMQQRLVSLSQSLRAYLLGAVTLFLLLSFGSALLDVKDTVFLHDYKPMADASAWIASRSEASDLVFLDDWSNFAMTFFYNPKNNYTVGMEPTSILEYDPKLFWKWFNIHENKMYCGLPKNCYEEKLALIKQFKDNPQAEDTYLQESSEQMLKDIKNEFKSKYIITTSTELSRLIMKSSGLIKEREAFKSEKNESVVTVFELR